MPAPTSAPATTSLDLDHLQSWVGRTETRSDAAAPSLVQGLYATLDRAPPAAHDAPLPHAVHWLFFQPDAPMSALGPDGHPARGGFLPPVPLERRMWASSDLRFHHRLRAGSALERTSEVVSVDLKEGKAGSLVFVRVRHDIADEGGLAVSDTQTIVYRAGGGGPAKGRPSETKAVWARTLTPTETLLFRYSALTFNTHRIHYDHPYTTGVEGYPGLVVHGPLTATLLLDLCAREKPERELASFRFRAVKPLFCGNPVRLCGAPDEAAGTVALWAEDHEGDVAMQAEAAFA